MHAKSKCLDDQQPGPSRQVGSTRKQPLGSLEKGVRRSDDELSQPGPSNANYGLANKKRVGNRRFFTL